MVKYVLLIGLLFSADVKAFEYQSSAPIENDTWCHCRRTDDDDIKCFRQQGVTLQSYASGFDGNGIGNIFSIIPVGMTEQAALKCDINYRCCKPLLRYGHGLSSEKLLIKNYIPGVKTYFIQGDLKFLIGANHNSEGDKYTNYGSFILKLCPVGQQTIKITRGHVYG